MAWVVPTHDWDRWRNIISAAMNFVFQLMALNFLSSCGTFSFLIRLFSFKLFLNWVEVWSVNLSGGIIMRILGNVVVRKRLDERERERERERDVVKDKKVDYKLDSLQYLPLSIKVMKNDEMAANVIKGEG